MPHRSSAHRQLYALLGLHSYGLYGYGPYSYGRQLYPLLACVRAGPGLHVSVRVCICACMRGRYVSVRVLLIDIHAAAAFVPDLCARTHSWHVRA